jgi:bacterioferritin
VHDKTIAILNKAIAGELSAVHQYLYFHFHCADQGYEPLAVLFKRTAITEMGHAEKIAERILFLGGDAEMVAAEPVEKIQDVAKMLAKAKRMEAVSAADYNQFALECSKLGDSISKRLFEELVADEEHHYDSFDIQEQHLERFGEQFLALQSVGTPAAAE